MTSVNALVALLEAEAFFNFFWLTPTHTHTHPPIHPHTHTHTHRCEGIALPLLCMRVLLK